MAPGGIGASQIVFLPTVTTLKMQDSLRRERFAFWALNDGPVGGGVPHWQPEQVLALCALPVVRGNPVCRAWANLIDQKSHGGDGQNRPGK